MTSGNLSENKKPNTAEFLFRLFVPFAWAGIILWLSLTSSPPQLPGILGWDKLLHAGAYGLFSLLIAQFLLCLPLPPRKVWWQAGVAAVCFGALLEILQLLAQTGRTAEWLDLLADAVGVFFSCVIFRRMIALACRKDGTQDDNHG